MTSSTDNIPGQSLLGYLYNVFTCRYANYQDQYSLCAIDGLNQDVKTTYAQTCKANNQTYDLPTGLQYSDDQTMGYGSTAEGASRASYQSNLSARASLKVQYGLFTGSVNAAYGSEITTNQQDFYINVFDVWSYYLLDFNVQDVDTSTTDIQSTDSYFCLSKELYSAFTAIDINDSSGQSALDWFNNNGTHVLTGIIMGGQASYSMYGAQSNFDSESDFDVNAKAKYSGMTGSAAFSGQVSGATSDKEAAVMANESVLVSGGSTSSMTNMLNDPSSENYTTWSQTVPSNLAWIDYSGDGLTPVWEFCPDSNIATYLENVFNQLCGVSTFETPHTTTTECKDGTVDWNSSPNQDHTLSWSAPNASEVMVGFGGNINNDNHFHCMIVISYNVNTGEYNTYYGGGADESTKFEAFYMVPQGYVITGIGLSEGDHNLYHLSVWYQKLKLIDQSNPSEYLDSSVHLWSGSQHSAQTVELDNLPTSGLGWSNGGSTNTANLQRYYQPASGNQYIISGIKAHCSSNSNSQKHGFDFLEITQGTLSISESVLGLRKSS